MTAPSVSAGKSKYEKSAKAPIVKPTIQGIAWAAGIFEGEGYCATRRKGHLVVDIVQKDWWLPFRLRDLFGGSVNYSARDAHPHYSWNIFGSRAAGFLMTIYKFLSEHRQEQVSAALLSWRTA